MKKMLLSEIVSNIDAIITNFQQDIMVSGISTDTRSLKKGDLFFALTGTSYDGHDFISIAQAKGACAIVSSYDQDATIPILKVNNTLTALQHLAAYYRTKFQIPVIAVTGSNGKTTTKNMIATVLSAKYKVYSTDKNYNNEIGLPKSVLELDDSYDVAVFEIGMNHRGEIKTLAKIAKPDIAVITNIGMAHIGNLGSLEQILAAKLEIRAGLKEHGVLLLNGDDPLLRKAATGEQQEFFVGTAHHFDLSAQNVKADTNPTYFEVIEKERRSPCFIPTIGKHNVTNALLAILCGLHLNVEIAEAMNEIKRYTAAPMRTELFFIKGVTIIKDYYNTSPESAKEALNILANYRSKGKKIALLGNMDELGEYSEAAHYHLAKECCCQQLDYVFFLGSEKTAFMRGIRKNHACFEASQRDKLSNALKEFITSGNLKKGDVILIKGSRNMKMEEFYEEIKSYINAAQSDFIALPPSPTKLYVDISAIKYNYVQIKKAIGNHVEIMPMIKANAYGCGTDIIANVFQDNKYLAIADVKEAALVRRILPNANFVIIYQPYIGDMEAIVMGNYISAVSSLEFANQLNQEALKQAKKVRIHLEVDTGAGRLGIPSTEAHAFAQKIKSLEHLIVEGVFMHYSCAESNEAADMDFTKQQTQRFTTAIAEIEAILGSLPYKHACSGAAIFNQNANHFDLVRPGYMLYGYYPGASLHKKVSLKPALKFVSVILQINDRAKGTPISYNRRFYATRDSRIATIAVGYSDGISRLLYQEKNEHNGCFVVNGQRAPIVGSICMDLTMIDITDIEGPVSVGDEVAIFDNDNVTVEEMAEICNTIGYEIIAQIEDKADRVESF
jgi:alanine racemase